MQHPFSWLVWAAAVLIAFSLTRNPVYLTTLLLVVLLTGRRLPARAESALPFVPLRLLAILLPLSALFNALTTHFGETVLVRLPQRLPLLGGAVTLEGLVFGLLNGLILAGILFTFQVLNRVLPLRALLRLVPRAFYPLAVVVSIAVTFIPLTVRRWEAIRTAQALRGHRLRGLRDLPPLFLPLLVGGLEQALQLAEAMAARGFTSHATPLRTGERLTLSFGLGALLTGWLLAVLWGQRLWGTVASVTGALLLGLLILRRREMRPHSVYHPLAWQSADTLGTLGALLALALLLWPGVRATLAYTPYPTLHAPPFAWLPLVVGGLLLVPALWGA